MRDVLSTSGGGSHPGLDQWIAYHGGELSEPEVTSLRAHLSRCSECVSLVLDLEAFENPAEDQPTVSELEMAAAWRTVQAALPNHVGTGETAGGTAAAPRKRPVRRRYASALAMAASLAAGVFGLTLWRVEHRTAAELRQAVAAQTAPQVNLAIRDLEPNRATRSGETPSPTELRRDEFSALVMLPSRSFESYAVEIVDARGEVAWSGTGLLPHPDLGTVTLGLPPGSLAAGDFHVRLAGGADRVPLEEELPIRVLP